MKQLIKISFLFVLLFLTVPVFAEGDMGAGGRAAVSQQQTETTKSRISANQGTEDFFSWICKQIFDLID